MENLLLTKKEAADSLRISVATLDCIRKCGFIKPIKIDARVYYTPAELRRLLEKKEIPTFIERNEVPGTYRL